VPPAIVTAAGGPHGPTNRYIRCGGSPRAAQGLVLAGKVRASRVLTAMGYDETVAASAIRVSLGPATQKDDALRFAEAWLNKEKKHRARAA